MALGYAAISREGLLVKTVSETRIGALVNYLCVYEGVVVMDGATQTELDLYFVECQRDHPELRIASVTVNELSG